MAPCVAAGPVGPCGPAVPCGPMGPCVPAGPAQAANRSMTTKNTGMNSSDLRGKLPELIIRVNCDLLRLSWRTDFSGQRVDPSILYKGSGDSQVNRRSETVTVLLQSGLCDGVTKKGCILRCTPSHGIGISGLSQDKLAYNPPRAW